VVEGRAAVERLTVHAKRQLPEVYKLRAGAQQSNGPVVLVEHGPAADPEGNVEGDRFRIPCAAVGKGGSEALVSVDEDTAKTEPEKIGDSVEPGEVLSDFRWSYYPWRMQAGCRRPDASARTGDVGSAGGIAERVVGRVAERADGHHVLAVTAAVHYRVAMVDTDREGIVAADNGRGGTVPWGPRRPEWCCRTWL
jgi:hypothetical protein